MVRVLISQNISTDITVNAIALEAIGWKYYIPFLVTDLIQVIVAYFIIVETRGEFALF